MHSVQAADTGLRIAVLDDSGWPSSRFAAAGRHITTFSFPPDDERDAHSGSQKAAGQQADKPAYDYGSIYNIPAENATFSVVVMPVLTEGIEYPYAAIKESLRLLGDNGLLAMTYRFVSDSAARGNGHAQAPALALRRAWKTSARQIRPFSRPRGSSYFASMCFPPNIPGNWRMHDSGGFGMKRLEIYPMGAS